MAVSNSPLERVCRVLEDADEPLTAREILDAIDDDELDSPHRVATLLGRHADIDDVEVIRDRPYRYRV